MIIECKDALKRARVRIRCEWCRKAQTPMDAAHIFTVGAGRVDADWNLCSLCRVCHSTSHNGSSPSIAEMMTIAALRCKCSPDDISAAVFFIRRQDKAATPEKLTAALDEIRNRTVVRLVRDCLKDARRL